MFALVTFQGDSTRSFIPVDNKFDIALIFLCEGYTLLVVDTSIIFLLFFENEPVYIFINNTTWIQDGDISVRLSYFINLTKDLAKLPWKMTNTNIFTIAFFSDQDVYPFPFVLLQVIVYQRNRIYPILVMLKFSFSKSAQRLASLSFSALPNRSTWP